MLSTYVVTTPNGSRKWQADDEAHAREQHLDAFADDSGETILSIREEVANDA